MLVLVNPLVEVGLEEVDLLRILQQPWPELLLELLLSQDKLNVLGGVADFALLLVDLAVELKLDSIVSLQRVRVAFEAERCWLQVELEFGGLDIGNGDREVDEVLRGFSLVGSLSPED